MPGGAAGRVEGGRLSVGCAADVVVFDPRQGNCGGREPLPLPRQEHAV